MSDTQKKVLVTGGAGFIGSHLVAYLLDQGYGVTVLDNFRNGKRENLPLESPALSVMEGDIVDAATCREASDGRDIVFHLACLGVRHSIHNPRENHEVNALGTLNVLEGAKCAGVGRVVYVSSSEVYGATDEFPIKEATATWPLTVYGASKLAGEHYTRAYHECYGMSTVCVRPFNNFGPRSHFEGDAGEVIPRFILRVLSGLPPVIFGDGTHTRDFLYVSDCVRGLLDIALCDTLTGCSVNLGYGSEVSIGELAKAVLSATGRTDLEAECVDERPADVPRLWAETSLLREHVEFVPKVGIEEGIGRCLEYFRGVHADTPNLMDQIRDRNWEVS
ncbi:MAG: NAD-dependent epimerase/dehydratase family protein [Verrucomicrobiota bacterium]